MLGAAETCATHPSSHSASPLLSSGGDDGGVAAAASAFVGGTSGAAKPALDVVCRDFAGGAGALTAACLVPRPCLLRMEVAAPDLKPTHLMSKFVGGS